MGHRNSSLTDIKATVKATTCLYSARVKYPTGQLEYFAAATFNVNRMTFQPIAARQIASEFQFATHFAYMTSFTSIDIDGTGVGAVGTVIGVNSGKQSLSGLRLPAKAGHTNMDLEWRNIMRAAALFL
ncbi:hypothetical protein EVAR_104034_1 [Eumeta japonica]|uniref:Uncharacterized protein n=1 Tax=Eumeta variegata TaxID=151549 RepID=A0A4C1SCV6_EUMVA|nr:hypothetical protein EVAR_104034_1 [Eumeta japonica]